MLEVSREEYERIEAGQSPIEEYGPLFLRFAEVIEQPVFNLFYPFGLPLDKLSVEDYRSRSLHLPSLLSHPGEEGSVCPPGDRDVTALW
jgi:hypothetical protein